MNDLMNIDVSLDSCMLGGGWKGCNLLWANGFGVGRVGRRQAAVGWLTAASRMSTTLSGWVIIGR